MNEAKDSLQSRALLSILDLIGEGEIEGLVNGERSIFFNETPLRNADGTYNFNGVTTAGTYGTNTQSPLTGFGSSVETPYNIGVRLNALSPYTFSVTNSAADLARVIINIPALSKTNPENGDIDGTAVQYKFQLSVNGGAFQDVEVDAAYVDNVTWAQVGGYWQVTAAAGSSKLIASITATSTGNGVGQIVVQPQEFNGSSWVNLGEPKTVDVIGAWESTYSEAPTFKTRASLSMPVESVYNTIRFVPLSTRLDSGTSIQLAQGNASYWKRSATVTVSGKTRSKYQRSHIVRLPTPRTSAQIRVTRITADATDSLTVNETWIESFTEITSLNISYPNSALVGVRIDAQQFNSIPSRAYLVDGLKIQVPSNYNPVTRTYTGVWNGTFQTAYSNNPAWVLYDILTNNRYGLGNYITSTQVDKAALYTVGKYCDEMVPDGFGGTEPRFTINTVIQSAADAYKVITDITSAFRGMAFWDGGVVGFTQDAPADPSMLYTNANVVDGMFTYTGSSRRDRHSVVHVTWNDPSDNYKRKVEYVEDPELIQRFGIRRVDTLAFGCTSRGQAARVGKWILYTERYESDIIQFKVGLDSAFLSPGEIIKIHDRDKSGKRFGGRLTSFTSTTAVLDSPVTLTTGTATISLMMPDGTFVERTLSQTPGTHTNVSWATPLTQLPASDAIWMLSQASLEPTLARVIAITQGENNTFEIAAIEHNPSKFGAIEQGLTLQTRTTSIIDAKFVDTPESLRVVERSVLNAIGQPEVKLSISWYSNATTHEVAYRNISEDRGGNWTTVTVTNETLFELTDPSKGEYEIAITAINPLGRRSKTARINFVVAGKLVNNDLPTALTIRPLFSGIALTWTNAGNKDFAGVEIWRSTTNVLLSAIRLDAVTTSTYSDMSVDFEDGEHFYWIRAFDTYGNYTGYVGPVNGVALDLPDNTSDTSTPPAPTGLTATAGLATIMLEWASPAYTNHKTTEVWASVSNAVASATLVGSTDTTMFAHALGTTGATRYYWIRFKSKADIVGPYNAVAGVSATTGKVGTADLGPLVVEAGNLANNAVTVDKILAGSVNVAKFASDIEPVTVVVGSTVPTTKSTNTIFLTGTSKIYRWSGSAYIATVPTADLSGTVSDAQIAGMAASKVTGQLSDSQIADVGAAKLTGQVVASQIADASISTAKFASGIEPVTVVSSVPGTKSTNTIYNTTDGKVYRWSGSAYVATVAAADISGTLAAAQIASLAASQITGQLSDTQLAAISAAKVTGQLVATQIADAAITTAKFASGIEPLTVITGVLPTTKSTNALFRTDDQKVYRWSGTAYVATVPAGDISGTLAAAQIASVAASQITGQLSDTQLAAIGAAKVTGQITGTQITDGAISTAKLAAGSVTAAVIAADTITAAQIAANAITSSELAAGAVVAGKIAAGSIQAGDIAAGTITGDRLAANTITASQIAGNTITAGQIAAGAIGTSQLAANAVTAAKIAAGAITANEIAAATITGSNIAGGTITGSNLVADTITAAQIAASAITSSELAAGAVVAGKIAAGTIQAADIAAGTITGDRLAANTITASQIAADTITAGQIAAGAIGASEIAANAVTTSKLLVSGIGSAINDDPNTQDVSAWTGGSFGLFNDATSPTGSALSLSSLSATTFSAKTFPLDAAKNYTLRIKARVSGGSTVPATLTVAFYNTSGTLLTGTAYPTGWPNVGTYHYFGLVNQVPPSSWTEYSISFGPDEVAKIPSGAAGLRIGFERGSSGVPGSHLYTSIRLMEKAAADLIVNGAISAAKLTLSDLTNIADNGDFEAGRVGWSDTSYISNDSTNAYSGNWVLAMPGGGAAYAVRNSLAIPVSPGEDYYADAFIKGTGTATGYVRIRGLNSANSEIWTQASTAVTGAYQQVSTTGTVPANVVRINVEIVANAGSGTVYADRVRMLRRSNASLIVDGAITASKIATDAVTANSIAANAVTAAKIEAGAVTAAKIAAGSIDASKIAAGTITANEIAGSTITGAKIAAGTITGSNIAADTITAGQIAAGAISASELAVGAVRAQHILVAPKSLNLDPSFEGGTTAWTGFVQRLPRSNAAVPANCPVPFAAQFNQRDNPSVASIEVVPGEVYKASCYVNRGTGSGGSGIGIYGLVLAADGSTVSTFAWPGTSTTATGWNRVSGQYVIPANGATLKFGPWADRPTYTGESWYADLNVEKAADASLVVDGAVTADKIAANAITAGKLAANSIAVGTAAIQNGAIVNAMIGNAAIDDAKIANATITSAKIASLSVDKLTAGNLAINQYIRSNSYTAGSSGWTINADGTAEFGAASIRGQLTASQINSNGLTIKDNAGNILFGVGNPLDFSNVGGATKPAANATKNTISQGTLAARPTGGDGDFYYATDNFTLYQKISGTWVASSNQTYVDGSGQMQGVSSGAGTTVANSQISISGGAIQGIGTGAGTAVANSSIGINASGQITGIGTGVNTTVANSQITIASGAIQGIGTGAGTAVANSSISVSGGAIQGIGTGDGTAVANSLVSLSSTGALQNAGGGQMTTLIASDTRNDNQAPSWYAAGLTEEFKNRSAIGAPGSAAYGILRTEKPWTDASGGVVTQTFKSEEGEWKRTSTPGSYATWTSWAPKADRQLSSSNISTFVANDAIGISQIGTTLQTTNFSSTAGWQINKSGTATFNDVALRGAVNSGSYTGYAWPASGTGFHLGPNGLLLGNYNVVLGNGKRRYFQVEASGNVYSPGFNIIDGDAVFSGTVSANVINTDAIIGGAASTGVATTSAGASASVVVTVPAGASAVLIEYYLGPPTSTYTGGGGKGDGGGYTYGPVLTGLTANGATTAGIIVSPSAGTYTVTCTRAYYAGTMRLGVVVLKR